MMDRLFESHDDRATWRAKERWLRFERKLDHADRQLLDRLAVGDELKVAAHAAGLNYDCARKRVVRHAAALNLRSTEMLYSVWRKVHRFSETRGAEMPTVLRVADRLAAHGRDTTSRTHFGDE
jgi:hypothetical protein